MVPCYGELVTKSNNMNNVHLLGAPCHEVQVTTKNIKCIMAYTGMCSEHRLYRSKVFCTKRQRLPMWKPT